MPLRSLVVNPFDFILNRSCLEKTEKQVVSTIDREILTNNEGKSNEESNSVQSTMNILQKLERRILSF